MLTGQNFEQIKQYFSDVRRELDRSEFWSHDENFRKKPYINTDTDPGAAYSQATVRNQLAANDTFQAAGTNMTTALVTAAVGGGVTLTTAGANNDQAILQPFTQTSVVGTTFGASGASGSVLNTSNQPQMHAVVSLSSIAAVRFCFGLKLTNAPDITTDNDQAEIMFSTSGAVSTSQFTVNSSIGGTDVEALARSPIGEAFTPAAATTYVLGVTVNSDRIARYMINGQTVGFSGILTANTGLWPVIGVQALTGAAKAVTVRSLLLGAKF